MDAITPVVTPAVTYTTALEYARANGISKQWVVKLCRDGRMKGAYLAGAVWAIPVGTPVPDKLTPGPKMRLDSSRAVRAQEKQQRAVEREATEIRQAHMTRDEIRAEARKRALASMSPRERWIAPLRERGWKRIGRWIDADGEYFGPWWMDDETEEAFRVRDAEWLEWDKEGRPVELTPKDFAEWLAGN